jgi:hypothetical protein
MVGKLRHKVIALEKKNKRLTEERDALKSQLDAKGGD